MSPIDLIRCAAFAASMVFAVAAPAAERFVPAHAPVTAKDVPATCANLNGASVFSQEPNPVYLGFFGSASAANSIGNPASPYGSTTSATSVRNSASAYGSSSGNFSAMNSSATLPPLIVKYGLTIGFLTTNQGASSSDYPFEIDRVSLITTDQACTFTSTIPSQPFSDQTGAGNFDVSWTGFWWNPNRSGEGLLLEFAEFGGTPILFATYFTYDLSGNPLYIAGSSYFDRSSTAPITMNVVTTSGAHFGAAFNPNDVRRTPWGTMTITIASCESLTLSYVSTVPGYGSGTIGMQRFLDRDPFTTCP